MAVALQRMDSTSALSTVSLGAPLWVLRVTKNRHADLISDTPVKGREGKEKVRES